MEKPISIKLDTKRRNIEIVNGLKQGDSKSVIYIRLLQDSLPFNLTGLTLRANFSRPDRVGYYQDSTTGVAITNATTGEVKVAILSEVLDKAGIVEADISVFEGTSKISSATFKLNVEESVYSEEALQNRSEFDLIQKTLNDVTTIESRLGAAADIDNSLREGITTANTLKGQLDNDISTGNTLMGSLEASISVADTKKTELQNVINTADTVTYATKGEVATLKTMNDVTAEVQSGINVVNTTQASPAKVKFNGIHVVNQVFNGDFSKGTEGWVGSSSTLSCSSNTLIVTGNGATYDSEVFQDLALSTIQNKVLYVNIKARVTNDICSAIALSFSGTNPIAVTSNPVANKWYTLSGIFTNSNYFRLLPEHLYADAATASGKVMEMQHVHVVDITNLPAEHQTKEWCDANLPFTPNVQQTVDPYVLKRGKNLFNKSKYTDYIDISKLVVGKTYILSSNTTILLMKIAYSVGGTELKASSIYSTSWIFTPSKEDIECGRLYLVRPDYAAYTQAEISTMNIQLELGSTATQYEPYNEDKIQLLTDLYTGESASEVNGQYVKTKKWKKVVLDETLPWEIAQLYDGFKRVDISNFISDMKDYKDSYVIKYDGKILLRDDGTNVADYFNHNGYYLWINISNVDSGWDNSYIPTIQNIQDYFKRNPYTFYYESTTPTTEIVESIGSISLHEGGNQIELSPQTTATLTYEGNIKETVDALTEKVDNIRDDVDSNTVKLKQFSSINAVTNLLKQGINVIYPPQSSPTKIRLEGRHLVNLLGRDGNCESLSGWNTDGTTLDTYVKLYGNASLKQDSTGGTMYMFRDVDNLNSTHTYVVSAWVNISRFVYYAPLLEIYDYNSWNNEVDKTIDVSRLNQWQRVSITFTGRTGIRVFIGAYNGSENYTMNIDGIMVYDLTSIYGPGSEPTDIPQLEAELPYVDSVQPVRNPYLVKKGRNLLPPFSQWNLHANAKVVSPYELQLDATGAYQESYVIIDAAENQPLTISITDDNNSAYAYYHCLDLNGTILSDGTIGLNTVGKSTLSWITPVGTQKLRVSLLNTTTTGTFTFKSPMLNLGSTPLPFEPYNEDYMYMETELYSGESVEEVNGGYVREKKWTKRTANDIPNWELRSNNTGWKRVAASDLGLVQDYKCIVTKYDGKILRNVETGSFIDGDDQLLYGTTVNTIHITISNTDSGWGDSYTPTADEIKAYFMGWRMCNNVDYGLYNGTGSKVWYKIGETPVQGTTVLPTTMNDQGYTPYELHYQLATPVTEVVKTEGAISLHDGANQIEVGTGVIVREKVNPQLCNNIYYINSLGVSRSNNINVLTQRVGKILNIYKNGQIDNLGTIGVLYNDSISVFGNYNVIYTLDNFDTTATYTVTYVALDKYKLSTNPKSVSLTYEADIKESLDLVIQKQSDMATKLSVVETTYAKKQQGQWLTPTLLNGWVNFGGFVPIRYFKDEFDIVHIQGMIKDGSVGGGTTIFTLPDGYKIGYQTRFVVDTANSYGLIDVLPNGNVNVVALFSIYTAISISFRAEQ